MILTMLYHSWNNLFYVICTSPFDKNKNTLSGTGLVQSSG